MSKSTWLAIAYALGATAALTACGDEEEPTTPMTGGTSTAASTTSTTTSTTSSGGGMGGMGVGGAGGGAGGAGGGTGGAGGGGPSINGCTDADFQPPGNPNVVINFADYFYDPKCLLIPPGEQVTFSGMGPDPFMFHPLRAGAVVGSMIVPDPSSPIQNTDAGAPSSVTFTFPNTGDFGYYCFSHYDIGMLGAIRVQP